MRVIFGLLALSVFLPAGGMAFDSNLLTCALEANKVGYSQTQHAHTGYAHNTYSVTGPVSIGTELSSPGSRAWPFTCTGRGYVYVSITAHWLKKHPNEGWHLPMSSSCQAYAYCQGSSSLPDFFATLSALAEGTQETNAAGGGGGR